MGRHAARPPAQPDAPHLDPPPTLPPPPSGLAPSYRVTSPVTGASYSVLMRRALTARQAALLQRGRRHRGWGALGAGGGGRLDGADSDMSSDDGLEGAGRLGSIGPSHPISGTNSGRASDAGVGSDAGSSVLGGVPALPPRSQSE